VNCTISNNRAKDGIHYGGGVACINASATFRNCSITDNFAFAIGGGVFNDRSTSVFIGCTISRNTSSIGGGILAAYSKDHFIHCLITHNTALSQTGGVHYSLFEPRFINCVIANNVSAGAGQSLPGIGGMDLGTTYAVLVNCSILNNYSAVNFGGISCGDETLLVNCILQNPGTEIRTNAMRFPTVTYSNIEGGYPGIGNISSDPMIVDVTGGDYHLLPGSPCIDAGDSTAAAEITYDLDGKTRVLGSAVDLGAYEFYSTENTGQFNGANFFLFNPFWQRDRENIADPLNETTFGIFDVFPDQQIDIKDLLESLRVRRSYRAVTQ